jgi:ClpP class serine protease
MNVSLLFFLFLIFTTLQPVIRQRMLETARRRKIRELEQKRGSRVIVLIHRQETLALLGFPLARYINIQDSEEILRAVKLTDPELPIDLVLHTPGGLVLASKQIAYALCRHPGKVTVFVPHYALSGGTMLALSADEIVMDENAVLGPVDPQVGQAPAASILRVIEQKDVDHVDDQTLILADVAQKAVNQIQVTLERLLKMSSGISDDRAADLALILSSGRWTHDYPITVDEAEELGLPISTDMPEEVYQMMSLYPQTSQRRPTVEYIPVPYPPQSPSPSGSGGEG